MGKFTKHIREHDFVSLEEMICDIVKEVKDCENGITIEVSCMEVPDILTALISTDKYKIDSIQWALPEIEGYGYEYSIVITKFDDGCHLYCEKAYSEDRNDYYNSFASETDVLFISQDVTKTLFDKRVEEGHNVVLYDIEK